MSRSTTWKDHAGVSQHRPPNQLSIERISLYDPILNPMPYRLATPCSYRGCPKTSHERFCSTHAPLEQKEIDSSRLSSCKRGYDRRWRKVRLMYLRANPLCEPKMPRARELGIGCGKPARVVDHIVPKECGGQDIESNLQSLCDRCHNRKRATVDKQGEGRGKSLTIGRRRPSG